MAVAVAVCRGRCPQQASRCWRLEVEPEIEKLHKRFVQGAGAQSLVSSWSAWAEMGQEGSLHTAERAFQNVGFWSSTWKVQYIVGREHLFTSTVHVPANIQGQTRNLSLE